MQSSSSKLSFPTWFFKIQVQTNRGKSSSLNDILLLLAPPNILNFLHACVRWLFWKCVRQFAYKSNLNLSRWRPPFYQYFCWQFMVCTVFRQSFVRVTHFSINLKSKNMKTYIFKVENISKGSLDPITFLRSVKIQLMGGKVWLRCKSKTFYWRNNESLWQIIVFKKLLGE